MIGLAKVPNSNIGWGTLTRLAITQIINDLSKNHELIYEGIVAMLKDRCMEISISDLDKLEDIVSQTLITDIQLRSR